ncbi:MAG: sigma-70 family RNA polymerase sigma factor [Clostridiales bacterium]|nr:sigma-70 family RNA polymerase sigma factor [Clostridiales bacterium]
MDERTYMDGVLRCEQKLYRVAYSILLNDQDAADAIQEAVLKGWRARFRLRDPEKLESWLVRIVVNECRNLQRRMKNRPRPIDERFDAAGEPPPDIGLAEAIRKLPEKYRLLIVLHYAEGYSMREVARIQRISEELVKSRLRQARDALRELLSREVVG